MSDYPQGLTIRPEREDRAMQVVITSPTFRRVFEDWLHFRGLALFPIPIGPDEDPDGDLPTYGIGPKR